MIYKASDLPWHEIHKSTLFFLLKKKNVISFDWISFQNYFISFLFVGISFYLVITEENILCSPSTLSSLITLLLVGGLKVSVCRQDSDHNSLNTTTAIISVLVPRPLCIWFHQLTANHLPSTWGTHTSQSVVVSRPIWQTTYEQTSVWVIFFLKGPRSPLPPSTQPLV